MTTALSTSMMLGFALLALAATAAHAQPIATTLDALQQLGSRRFVTITDGTGHEFRGTMTDVSGSRLCLQLRTGVRCFDAVDVDAVRVRKDDSLVNGALIGAAVGGGLTSLIFLDNECRTSPVCYGAVAFYSGVGAAAGLVVDALIHGSLKVYEAPSRKGAALTVGPLGPKGVRLTILF